MRWAGKKIFYYSGGSHIGGGGGLCGLNYRIGVFKWYNDTFNKIKGRRVHVN